MGFVRLQNRKRGIAQDKEKRKTKIVLFLAQHGSVQRKEIWKNKDFDWRNNNRLLITCLEELEKEGLIDRKEIKKIERNRVYFSLKVDADKRREIQAYMQERDSMFEKAREEIQKASQNLNEKDVRDFFEAFIYSMFIDFIWNQTDLVDPENKFPILTKEILTKFDIDDFNTLLRDFYEANPKAYVDVLENVFTNFRLLRKEKWPSSETENVHPQYKIKGVIEENKKGEKK